MEAGDQFVTKDSGQRQVFSTGMHRDTSENKLRFDLIIALDEPPDESLFFRWAALLGRGAQKYSARNWEKAETDEELQRFKESAFRHFMQWFTGQRDEDHAAAVIFNMNGAEYVRGRMKRHEARVRMPEDIVARYARLEQEHLGDWERRTGIYEEPVVRDPSDPPPGHRWVGGISVPLTEGNDAEGKGDGAARFDLHIWHDDGGVDPSEG